MCRGVSSGMARVSGNLNFEVGFILSIFEKFVQIVCEEMSLVRYYLIKKNFVL